MNDVLVDSINEVGLMVNVVLFSTVYVFSFREGELLARVSRVIYKVDVSCFIRTVNYLSFNLILLTPVLIIHMYWGLKRSQFHCSFKNV